MSDEFAETGTMMPHKRMLCLTLAAAVLHAPHASAVEAAYPTRPLRLIVPYAPGGGVDGVGRLMAQDIAPRLGQQIVIDNRGGGGGLIGLDIAAHSAPDGYTLLVGSVAVTSMPGLHKKLPFDPIRDFAPITISVTGTYLLAVNLGVPAESVKELIALAKTSPGKLNFGSSGGGSTIHLAGEMLKSMAKIDIVHVPYKSAGLAMTDMIGGHIQMMFAPVLVLLPMAKAGKIRALGVTSAQRSALVPDVPTIAEAGVPGFEVSGWYGLLAPAATPRPIINRIYAVTMKGLESDAMKERLRSQGLEPIGLSPEQSAKFLREDIARWSRVIREAGIPQQ
ncbi:MAG TPA: tripartite tricarboxylate transporter substrate binding protein, partial [Burkholderiales bacterium]|nr:tripartite tricarboxylate transporter substrate binding protein [Burkholderiales bacterium]